jgi:hypothetical protein
MKAHRGARPRFAGSLLLSGVLLSASALSANEYYSWIDANGTMVMTDDPSRVPPATSRSQIQVHRFQPAAPVPSVAQEPVIAPHEASPPVRPDAVDPRDLDFPLVVLGEPDKSVGPQYVWVPLLSPLSIGGNLVNGFWWYPGPTSPVEAFKQFLAQHYREQRNQWLPGGGVPYPLPSLYSGLGSSGNSVFDQVVRERRALEESIRLRHFPAAANQPVFRGGEHHRGNAR